MLSGHVAGTLVKVNVIWPCCRNVSKGSMDKVDNNDNTTDDWDLNHAAKRIKVLVATKFPYMANYTKN